jgi:hypothetical protein
LIPFLVALVTAEFFQRVRLSGLAVIAGFAASVYLVSDFGLEPLTASKKIVLLGLSSALLGLLITLLQSRWLAALLPIIGAAATVWVSWRLLQQHPVHFALMAATASAAYVALLVWGMDNLENEPLRAANAATTLGIGTGAAALFGASALLGQFGLALGAAAAAHLLIQMIGNQPLSTGRAFTLPVALIAGLVGIIAVLGARLPWYSLPVLAAIPIAAWLVPLPRLPALLQSLLLSLVTFGLAAAAVYLAWRSAGDIPM